MLKWSVNAKRPEFGVAENPFEVVNTRDLPSQRTRRSLGASHRPTIMDKENSVSNARSPRTPLDRQRRRQSLGGVLSQKKRRSSILEEDKENVAFLLSPNPKSGLCGAFRDVSNITPTSTPSSNTVNSRRRKRSLGNIQDTNESLVGKTCLTTPYASTLPTFDIEYSPFGLHEKPFLDTYFNQPRYLTPQVQQVEVETQSANKQKTSHIEEPQTNSSPDSQHNKMIKSTPARMSSHRKRPRKFFQLHNSVSKMEDEETTTSADVGDLTLDHMIEAILESARNEPSRKTTKRRFSCNFKLEKPDLKSHFSRTEREPETFDSPTYQAGEDPASDLPEDYFRCPQPFMERIKEVEVEAKVPVKVDQEVPTPAVIFNEREIKTADSLLRSASGEGPLEEKSLEICVDGLNLRRNNALRRKVAKNLKMHKRQNDPQDRVYSSGYR